MLIKKGTIIELPIRASHYQPEFFPNPTKFEPERFLKENADQIIPYTFRAFGGNFAGSTIPYRPDCDCNWNQP